MLVSVRIGGGDSVSVRSLLTPDWSDSRRRTARWTTSASTSTRFRWSTSSRCRRSRSARCLSLSSRCWRSSGGCSRTTTTGTSWPRTSTTSRPI
uniref:Uncharacterized protein n=1 Tax=Anguilla anguilla TaxID=7936 RepID=A0A0E9RD86_ANGAN